MLNKFYETIIFSITFISSRFILFFFPLFFAIFLSKKDFIYFEQAIAISNILVPILTFGFFSLLPKILKENSINYKIEFIKIHNLLIVILLTIIAFLFHKDLLVFCTSIFTIFFVISRFILTVQKIRSKRNIALIIETSFFIILGIAIIYFNYENILFVSYFLIPFIILYFFSTFNLLEKNKIKSYFSKSNWIRYLNSSIPNLFSGFVIVFIFQYLKIIVPIFFDENESYNFLYIFRFSFIVMISYQFLSAFFFVKLISNNNEIRNKKIFILAKLNFFSLCIFLLIIYSLNKNYFFLNDIFFINNYLNLSILFDNFKIFVICSLFLHIFSFISLNNMISVSLLHEEKIWIKFLFFTIVLNLIFTFLNYIFVLNLAEFLIFYLLTILVLYTIYSLLINRELIKFKILSFNLISSMTILVVILFI